MQDIYVRDLLTIELIYIYGYHTYMYMCTYITYMLKPIIVADYLKTIKSLKWLPFKALLTAFMKLKVAEADVDAAGF